MKFETLITIKRDGRAKKRAQRWPVEATDRSKLLARRRTGGIRFWDLGYSLDGDEYATIPFLDPNRDDPIPHRDNIIGAGAINLPLEDELTPYNATFYDQINASIFAIPLTDWKTNFYQVDDKYQRHVNPAVSYKGTFYTFSDTSVWDGDRLLPNGSTPDADSFTVNIDSQMFTPFAINASVFGYRETKITATSNFADDAVAFSPSKSMDVFLVPNLLLEQFDAVHTRQTPGLLDFRFDFLNWLHTIYPREVLHDVNHDLYEYYLDAFSWSLGGTLAEYEEVYAVTDYWRTNRGERALAGQVFIFIPDVFTDIDPLDYAPASAFPPPPPEPTDPDLAQYMVATFAPKGPPFYPPSGVLIAVIKKGGAYYYVWAS